MAGYTLKPFVLNLSDLNFLLQQVSFLALFDAAGNVFNADSNPWNGQVAVFDKDGSKLWGPVGGYVYRGTALTAANVVGALAGVPLYDKNGYRLSAFDGNSAAYDVYGTKLWDQNVNGGYTYHGTALNGGNGPANNLSTVLGHSYASLTDASGLRDISGHYNNLLPSNTAWGATDQAFLHMSDGVTTTAAPHGTPIKPNYVDYVKPVDATSPDAFWGAKTFGSLALSTPAIDYTVTVDAAGTHMNNIVDYTPRMVSLTTTTGGVTYALDNAGHIAHDANGVAQVTSYGDLQTLGQQDKQNPGNTEFFIGATNPGIAPSNGWFALFGQFFDHGLDFIQKGGASTVKIALASDDPLYGVIGADGRPTTSITITRANPTGTDAAGNPAYINHTSPYIDQSQSYGSNAQVTNLLREWISTDNGATYHAGIGLLDGATLDTEWKRPDGTLTRATLPTLDELRTHLAATGRSDLTWEDVGNLRNRDAAGHVASGTSGQSLLLDMNPRFDAAHLHGFYDKDGNGVQDAGERSFGSGTQTAQVDAAIAVIDADAKARYGVNSSFGIDPITHKLTLFIENLPVGTPPGTPNTFAGASALFGLVNFADFSISLPAGPLHDAVGAILLASVGDHYIAGDGRANENFGLTSIHHVFHEEHNFQVGNLEASIHTQDAAAVAGGDTSHQTLHNWQVGVKSPAGAFYTNAAGDFTLADGVTISWDADKLFSAAKLVVEMEYQHVAVDQYARAVTPDLPEFVGYNSAINSTVSMEYAQGAFRFGHSTLRETIDTIDPNGGITGKVMSFALENAFLNPAGYAANGPAAIALGMSHQQMNEIDEFITPALNQGLLGQPLDLAAINIARGRDLGLPSLNDFRSAIGLRAYTSWSDFGQHMIHPTSLVNFIAAYAFDGNLAKAQAIVGLEAGTIAENDAAALGYTLQGAIDFLNGGDHGFAKIDTWLGGLAERHIPGGLLGETFNVVFVDQITRLEDGDRFYYLYRLVNQQFGEEVNNGQFKDIIERNTGLEHLNGSAFSYADQYYDFSRAVDPANTTGSFKTDHKYADLLASHALDANGLNTDGSADIGIGINSDGGVSTNSNGAIVTIDGHQYIRDIRPALTGAAAAAAHVTGTNLDGTADSGADSHEVLVGTQFNDIVHGREGDDTVYGDGGNDLIFGDNGLDRLYGGDGNDTIWGGEGADLVDGGAGDDLIYGEGSGTAANGSDQLVGGSGNDTIYGGNGIDKLSGGSGDDAIYGGNDTDPFTRGGDGNDYLDGGASGDLLYGDNGDDVVVGGDDQDVLYGGNGDDILRPGNPSSAAVANGPDEVVGGDGTTDTGFDLIDFSDYLAAPLGVVADMTTQQNPVVVVANPKATFPAWFQMEGVIGSQNNDTITGDAPVADPANPANNINGNNWLTGGSGNDELRGDGGNDLIIGDSIRLDSLIGTYANPYTMYDPITGASHRTSGPLGTNGLLDAAGVGTFAKHYTEMLKSNQFKDYVLGDTLAGGAADTVVFQGNRADYDVSVLNFVDAHGTAITAYKVVGARGAGVADGTDLVVGVEIFRFGNRTIAAADLLNHAPTGALGFVGTNNAAGTLAQLNISAANLFDADNITNANPLGAVTLPNTNTARGWQTSTDGGLTWTAFPAGTGSGQQSNNTRILSQGATAGKLVRAQATYTDAAGYAQTVTSDAWNLIVGAATGETVNGTNSATTGDIIFGLSGNDTINAGAGNDTLLGGAGSDRLNGDAGTDTAAFDGTLAAATFALAGGLVTVATATGGTDTLASVERVSFADATMTLVADTAATNALVGTAGNDLMLGFAGNDTLTGGTGNDFIDGGTGTNTAVFSGSVLDATFNLAAVTGYLTVATAADGTDTLRNIQNATFDDGTFNFVIGSNGNNTLTGTNGNDLMLGLNGNDILTGGRGNDILLGGQGTDRAVFSGSIGSYNLSLDAHNNIVVADQTAGRDGTDTLNSIENVTFGATTYSVSKGTAAADNIVSTRAPSLLLGGGGADTFIFSSAAVAGNNASRDVIGDFVDFHTNASLHDLIDLQNIALGSTSPWVFDGAAALPGFAANTAGHLHYLQIGGDTLIEGNTNLNGAADFQILLRGLHTLMDADFIK